ncbi:MAG: hypothetical protein Terrestrivirus11_32 [Terrestrivirus sp.]|uniref:Uncharacterized protein n=1 Tax=Terrestrivirus sp. TaxID=2487775 RepID=A0A3G4ZRS4_9VIRU|nr:MAG: hypothetical protein Terrestrivirus11_32 [Terrestrivirus sp.]
MAAMGDIHEAFVCGFERGREAYINDGCPNGIINLCGAIDKYGPDLTGYGLDGFMEAYDPIKYLTNVDEIWDDFQQTIVMRQNLLHYLGV